MRTARLFKNGQNQAVRLSKEFRFEGDMVYIKKSGSTVILMPMEPSWRTLEESPEHFSEDFMDEREQPEQQGREEF